MYFVLTRGDTFEYSSRLLCHLVSGLLYDNKTLQIIYDSLHEYKPTADGERLYGLLLEEFEEILAVD